MTTLSDRLVEYLDHRRRFGYRRIGTTAAVLRRFAAFADDFGAESITTELFLEWRKQFEAPSDVTWGCNLSHVRGFAKWLHCLDPRTEVPSADLIRRGNRRGRIPDFPVTRSHPPASWPSAANSSICRTYRKTAGEESRRRSPVANRWMRP